ncbi:hypothetical protein H6F50_21280 [Coleofasciculus sp. FACHB-712]|uniref:hypothetical protein n=1 Tax=Coleofasciculus sp. FACHB-712 TaxID=2692789 RepID=UPI001681CA40|nr:hypothetical protein [Coleofasciculus sp. FACHB-712]MBD1944859.1 hypothetical protein [Coleofasciculus sp. FACHB-712]
MSQSIARLIPKFKLWQTVSIRVPGSLSRQQCVITGMLYQPSDLHDLPGRPRWVYQIRFSNNKRDFQTILEETELQKV